MMRAMHAGQTTARVNERQTEYLNLLLASRSSLRLLIFYSNTQKGEGRGEKGGEQGEVEEGRKEGKVLLLKIEDAFLLNNLLEKCKTLG